MSDVLLTGFDGKNPIGFLAALGVLNALGDGVRGSAEAPRLVWRQRGTFVPALVSGPDIDALLDLLMRDLQSFREEPAFELRYAKGDGTHRAHDLKPPPAVYRDYLRGLVAGGSARSLAFASCLATDVARDNNGNAKPTALHFTAGQQEFLGMLAELRDGVSRDDLREALFGPWSYGRPLPILQWDNATSRDYALRASDPSKEKKLGVPGADWLAARGLTFLRVAPVGDRIVTTGCSGGWKTGVFRWPLWNVPLTREVISGLLTSPEILDADANVLEARGIAMVFEASIRRSDQGGYGSFSPARVATRKPSAERMR